MAEEEPVNEQGDPNPVSAKVWQDRLGEYKRLIEDKWEDQRKNLDKLYSREDRSSSADREYSLFWSNMEVLEGAVYSRTPAPVVAPRFKQPNRIASAASEVLERCLITSYEQHDCHGCIKEGSKEYLRYARATPWLRLDVKDEYECVEYDYVTACDFAHDTARLWREVKWVARRSWLTKAQGRERFNEYLEQYGHTFDDVPIKRQDENRNIESIDDQVPVWEIWSKKDGAEQVIWISEDFDSPLDVQDPWLKLSSFWPCPEPAFGTLVPGKMKPVPDILQYKDQLEEINEYTARIAAISEKLRLQGFYPSGMGEASEAIEAAIKKTDNRAVLIPISNWAQFGGTSPKDSIVWIPIKEAGDLVRGLVDLRRVLIDDVYQIVGISDILRGDTDPDETLGAQQLKSSWGGSRIKTKQNEIVRMSRDITRIAGEIIAENFQLETMRQMTQMDLPSQAEKDEAMAQMQQAQQPPMPGQPPPPPIDPAIEKMLAKPSFEEVFQFLRDDRARGFTIEIETDSTIQPDENAEKQRATEFIGAIGGLIQQAVPIVQGFAPAGKFVGELMKFGAQRFRAGRPLEGAIDEFVEQIEQIGQQPPQPNPEVMKAEAEIKLKEADLGMKERGQQADVQFKQKELGFKEQELAIKERAAIQDAELKRVASDQDMALREREFALKQGESSQRVAIERESRAGEQSFRERELRMKGDDTNRRFQMDRERGEADFDLAINRDGFERKQSQDKMAQENMARQKQESAVIPELAATNKRLDMMASKLDKRLDAIEAKLDTKPKVTRIIRDKDGRAEAAVQE